MIENTFALTIPGANGTPQVVQAPPNIPTGGLKSNNFIGWGITLFLIVCVLLALSFAMWGGFNFIMSQGDKAKIESARNTIIYAILGLGIALLAFFVINMFGALWGINLLNADL